MSLEQKASYDKFKVIADDICLRLKAAIEAEAKEKGVLVEIRAGDQWHRLVATCGLAEVKFEIAPRTYSGWGFGDYNRVEIKYRLKRGQSHSYRAAGEIKYQKRAANIVAFLSQKSETEAKQKSREELEMAELPTDWTDGLHFHRTRHDDGTYQISFDVQAGIKDLVDILSRVPSGMNLKLDVSGRCDLHTAKSLYAAVKAIKSKETV